MRFDELRKDGVTAQEVNAATEQVMRAISAIVGELRGETPPKELWDPAKKGQTEIGNFRKKK
jgi:hypothetical protein